MNIDLWDAASATEEALRLAYEFSVAILAEVDPETPPNPFELWRTQMQTGSSFHEAQRWLVRDGGAIVGFGQLDLDRSGNNAHRGEFHIEVAASHRRRGVAREVLRRIVDAADADGRTTLSAAAPQHSDGEQFLAAVGTQPAYLDRRSRLRVGKVDPVLVQSWIADAKTKAAEYSLLYFDGPIPDEHLASVIEVHAAMNDAPREGLDLEDEHDTPEHFREREARLFERGSRKIQVIARHDPSGQFAGFTTISWSPLLPQVAFQWGTAVRREHRGHAIGRWLKAANFNWLRELNPAAEFVDTWNAGSNQWMLAINDDLGFKPYIWYQAYQAGVVDIKKAIV